MTLTPLFQTMRLPFLILTPTCVLLGTSVATLNQFNINGFLLFLALLGALFAHISVNMLNEYVDFKSGLDVMTQKTQFSGGSGALPQHPNMAKITLMVGMAALMATLLIGVFFVWKYGMTILPIGVIGLILIVTYTDWINKYPWLCLVAPGIGFGFLMVVGTQFILSGEYTTLSWLVAAIPFFLVNNLLLLNQYPDIQADARVGRRHFPIVYGIKYSNIVYGVFMLATILAILGYVLLGYLPILSLLALLPMPLAFFALYGAVKQGTMIGSYPQYLGANVAVTLLVPLLLSISIIIGF